MTRRGKAQLLLRGFGRSGNHGRISCQDNVGGARAAAGGDAGKAGIAATAASTIMPQHQLEQQEGMAIVVSCAERGENTKFGRERRDSEDCGRGSDWQRLAVRRSIDSSLSMLGLKSAVPQAEEGAGTTVAAGNKAERLSAAVLDGDVLAMKEQKKNERLIIFVFCTMFLLEIFVNFDSGVIPAILLTLQRDFSIDGVAAGLLGALPYIGLVASSPFVGRGLTTCSPKWFCLITMLVNLIATGLLGLAMFKWMLFLSRLLIGLSQAGFSIYAPVWVDQFAPADKLTLWMGLAQGGVVLGTMLGCMIAGSFDTAARNGLAWATWRYALLIQALGLLVLLIIWLLLPRRFVDINMHQETLLGETAKVEAATTGRRRGKAVEAGAAATVEESASGFLPKDGHISSREESSDNGNNSIIAQVKEQIKAAPEALCGGYFTDKESGTTTAAAAVTYVSPEQSLSNLQADIPGVLTTRSAELGSEETKRTEQIDSGTEEERLRKGQSFCADVAEAGAPSFSRVINFRNENAEEVTADEQQEGAAAEVKTSSAGDTKQLLVGDLSCQAGGVRQLLRPLPSKKTVSSVESLPQFRREFLSNLLPLDFLASSPAFTRRSSQIHPGPAPGAAAAAACSTSRSGSAGSLQTGRSGATASSAAAAAAAGTASVTAAGGSGGLVSLKKNGAVVVVGSLVVRSRGGSNNSRRGSASSNGASSSSSSRSGSARRLYSVAEEHDFVASPKEVLSTEAAARVRGQSVATSPPFPQHTITQKKAPPHQQQQQRPKGAAEQLCIVSRTLHPSRLPPDSSTTLSSAAPLGGAARSTHSLRENDDDKSPPISLLPPPLLYTRASVEFLPSAAASPPLPPPRSSSDVLNSDPQQLRAQSKPNWKRHHQVWLLPHQTSSSSSSRSSSGIRTTSPHPEEADQQHERAVSAPPLLCDSYSSASSSSSAPPPSISPPLPPQTSAVSCTNTLESTHKPDNNSSATTIKTTPLTSTKTTSTTTTAAGPVFSASQGSVDEGGGGPADEGDDATQKPPAIIPVVQKELHACGVGDSAEAAAVVAAFPAIRDGYIIEDEEDRAHKKTGGGNGEAALQPRVSFVVGSSPIIKDDSAASLLSSSPPPPPPSLSGPCAPPHITTTEAAAAVVEAAGTPHYLEKRSSAESAECVTAAAGKNEAWGSGRRRRRRHYWTTSQKTTSSRGSSSGSSSPDDVSAVVERAVEAHPLPAPSRSGNNRRMLFLSSAAAAVPSPSAIITAVAKKEKEDHKATALVNHALGEQTHSSSGGAGGGCGNLKDVQYQRTFLTPHSTTLAFEAFNWAAGAADPLLLVREDDRRHSCTALLTDSSNMIVSNSFGSSPRPPAVFAAATSSLSTNAVSPQQGRPATNVPTTTTAADKAARLRWCSDGLRRSATAEVVAAVDGSNRHVHEAPAPAEPLKDATTTAAAGAGEEELLQKQLMGATTTAAVCGEDARRNSSIHRAEKGKYTLTSNPATAAAGSERLSVVSSIARHSLVRASDAAAVLAGRPKTFGIWQSICILFQSPVYICVTTALCALFFEVTAIQFWSITFFQQELKVPAGEVLIAFNVTAATGPILGVLAGGWFIDCVGGYKSSRGMMKTLLILGCWAVICLVLGFLACIVPNFIAIIAFIWGILFFGGGILPAATGIVIASVPPEVRAFGSGFCMMIYNVFGYVLGTLIPGAIIQAVSLYWGMRIIFLWSVFGVGGLFAAASVVWRLRIKPSYVSFDAADDQVPTCSSISEQAEPAEALQAAEPVVTRGV